MSQLEIITTNDAPAAIGPYSQAVRFGNLLFTSGQIPLGLDGQVVDGGIVEQTHQVFQNLQGVLKASGCELNDVIKATVFIKEMNQFAALNEVYASYFGDHKPARSTVEVARLPRDVLVEIELVVSIKVG
jgi:2-iminobutanoate/2-iminopropanoate deaminase